MRKNNYILRGAISAALGMSAGMAIAGSLSTAPTTYTAGGISSAATLVTVPAVTKYVTSGSLTNGSTLTFTLGGGATWGSVPSVSAGGASVSYLSGGTNQASVQYQVVTGASTGETLTLNGATISNASTALGTSVACTTPNTLAITLTGTYGGGSTDVFPSPTTNAQNYALSCNPVLGANAPAATAVPNLVNVTTGATSFVTSTTATTSVASVGSLAVGIGSAVSTGTVATSLSSVSAVVSGNFSGVGSVQLGTNVTCTSFVGTTGTPSGSTATVGLAINAATTLGVCLVSNGSQLPPSSTYTITPTITTASPTTSTASAAQNLGTLSLNGSSISSNYNVPGGTGAYTSYVTLTNPTAVAQSVYASVVYGGQNYFGLYQSLASNTTSLVSVAAILTAVGASPAADTPFSLTLYSTGTSLTGGGLLLNPDGVVSTMPGEYRNR